MSGYRVSAKMALASDAPILYDHLVQMGNVNRDPYYHVSKDKSYVTYPELQDTMDRLRSIRQVSVALQKGTRTTW